jgi:hypothetical protein
MIYRMVEQLALPAALIGFLLAFVAVMLWRHGPARGESRRMLQ